MSVTFERATLEDAEALLALQIAAFHDDTRLYGVPLGGPPGYDSLDVIRKAITEDEYYKIVHEGQIVGGLVVFKRSERHFHLDTLYIAPTHHNRGLGTQAMHFIERSYPAHLWTLHTPLYATRNQHFYEKFGYIKTGEEQHDIVLIAYEKRLTS